MVNFQTLIPQLLSLIETILPRRVERSVHCKFMVLLFLLAASYGRRGNACSQDSGLNMVCGTNRGKVELQDDRRSVSTLQSAV